MTAFRVQARVQACGRYQSIDQYEGPINSGLRLCSHVSESFVSRIVFHGAHRMKSSLLFSATLLGLAAMAVGAASGSVTDPQIAAIVVTANQVDIDAGKLAETNAHSPDVKKFAQLMIRDHASVNKAATDLV